VTQWQQDLAAAKARRRNGRVMEFIGAFFALNGAIATVLLVGHACGNGDCTSEAVIGVPMLAAGVLSTVVGHQHVSRASEDVARLLANRPSSQGGSQVEIPLPLSISVTVGQVVGVSGHVRW
jgi:hypothetical protein